MIQDQSRLDFSLFMEGDCTIFMCLLMKKHVLEAESVKKNGVETPLLLLLKSVSVRHPVIVCLSQIKCVLNTT